MHRVASAAESRNHLAQQTCACGRRDLDEHPVLVDAGGTPALRYAGCAACHQPPAIEVGLPVEVEQAGAAALASAAPGATRALDPAVTAALAPFVASGFPDYRSAEEQLWGRRTTIVGDLATGPAWRIVTWLRGSTGFGQARMQHDDGTRALATFTGTQPGSIDAMLRKLHHATPGITDLVGVRALGSNWLMLEEEPEGLPLSTPMFPLPLDAASSMLAQLATIIAGAEQRGEVLAGVRPELVYLDRTGDALRVSGVAPRAERFAAGLPEPKDIGPSFPFDSVYAAPEQIQGERARSAADVFCACATFVFALQRRSPFGVPGKMMPQLAGIVTGKDHVLPRLPEKIGALIRAGLDPDPTKRPLAGELVRLLV